MGLGPGANGFDLGKFGHGVRRRGKVLQQYAGSASMPRRMQSAPRLEGLHHIGIAVRSLDEALPRWTGLGLQLLGIEDVPTERVRVAILMAGSTRIELLEPSTPDSPVGKFLQSRGPGVHHLAFGVRDCQQQIDAMTASGAPMLNKVPAPGAHDCRVAFVHPKHLGGVLAEFVEDASP